ncbi:MAG: hypothetical protein JSS82_15475 [Bacteroidetes bacterium]|nr:hypothetical protein [Bacteroidota bacterium]
MIESEREKGLYQKYEVKKLSKPDKKLDCIVLEFDDPINTPALMCWAYSMRENGYHQVFADVCGKLQNHGQPTDDWGALLMHRVIQAQAERIAVLEIQLREAKATK